MQIWSLFAPFAVVLLLISWFLSETPALLYVWLGCLYGGISVLFGAVRQKRAVINLLIPPLFTYFACK